MMKLENAGKRCFNLEEVRIGTPFEVKDAMNIAAMIVDPDGEGLNDHYQKVSFSLLTALILYVLYVEPDKTIRGVAACLNDPDIFDKMMRVEHDPVKVNQAIAQSAKEMLNRSGNEQSGIISTTNYFLTPIVSG